MRKQVVLSRDSEDNITKNTDPQKMSILLTRKQLNRLTFRWIFIVFYLQSILPGLLSLCFSDTGCSEISLASTRQA